MTLSVAGWLIDRQTCKTAHRNLTNRAAYPPGLPADKQLALLFQTVNHTLSLVKFSEKIPGRFVENQHKTLAVHEKCHLL